MEWREIPGYPGYEASSDGEIRSARRPGARGGVIRQRVHAKRGYLTVAPSVGGKQGTRDVHMLVALAFLGPRPEGLEIRHLNGNKLDCRPSNLEYGTRSQNAVDRVTHGQHPYSRRTHCKNDHELVPCPWRPGRYCPICTRESGRANTAAYRARKRST